MKRIINNKGIGLIDTLIVATVISVTGFGLLKLSQHTALTSQITQTHHANRDLKQIVYKILNHKDHKCKDILKPDNLITTLVPDGFGGSFQKFKPETKVLIKTPIAESLQDFIDVVDMKLHDKSGEKTFYLYYKYDAPLLGSRQTKGGEDCDGNSLKGCYNLSCKIDYSCTENDCSGAGDYCHPLNCGGVEINFPDASCDEREVLVGFNPQGEAKCLGCPSGQVLIGINENTEGNKEAICLNNTTPNCEEGETAIGIKEDSGQYVMDCRKLACKNGKHIFLEDNGQITCKTPCHGGQRPDPNDNNKCKCLGSTEEDATGNCTCTGDKELQEETGDCVCPPGKIDDGNNNNGCECPYRKRDDGAGGCVCIDGTEDINGNCVCPKTFIFNLQNRCVCHYSATEENGKCVCPYPLIMDSQGMCVPEIGP